MSENKTANLLKHALRIVISAIIGVIIVFFVHDFGTFLNMLLFMGIYVVVSLILEAVFKNFKK